jgi:hypothetical protein
MMITLLFVYRYSNSTSLLSRCTLAWNEYREFEREARRWRGIGRARGGLPKAACGADVSLVNTLPDAFDGARADEELRTDFWIRQACRASRAIWSSCGVSSSRVSGLRLRTFSPSRPLAMGPPGERLHSDRDEHVVGPTQLLARVDASAFATQPLAMEQVRPSELRTHLSAAQPIDRFAIQLVGDCHVTQ